MNETIKNNWVELQRYFKNQNRVIIAFSGGVDSALLSYAANFTLKNKALAVVGVSQSYAEIEKKSALEFLTKHKINFKLIYTKELQNKNYIQNNSNRCYYCKQELYSKIQELAKENNIQSIIDGTNISDLNGHRPGQKALKELNIITPFIDLEFTKDDIRNLAKYLKLGVWDKAEMACLASRIPNGTPISSKKLKQVETCEAFLVQHNFKVYRVRYHTDCARIELDKDGISMLFSNEELRKEINAFFREQGFSYVSVDIQEFKSGSMSQKNK